MDTESLVADALQALGLDASPLRGPGGLADDQVDLVLIEPSGIATLVELKRRSLVDDRAVRQLLTGRLAGDPALLVVADRVTESARRTLTEGGAGYLDLRGHLAIRTHGLVLNSDVPGVKERPERTDALAGRAGLETAAALLMDPDRSRSVRELARDLRRSPSTVSDVLAALRADGSLNSDNTLAGTDLFWRMAQRWNSKRIHLLQPPFPGDSGTTSALRLGLFDEYDGEGWALTDSAAASAYGAPIAARSDQRLDFYVPDQSVLRRAATLLGVAEVPGQARATVSVAPVRAVVRQRIASNDNPTEWPLAHPVFVALDLAQDQGRGREILEAWTVKEPWHRVW